MTCTVIGLRETTWEDEDPPRSPAMKGARCGSHDQVIMMMFPLSVVNLPRVSGIFPSILTSSLTPFSVVTLPTGGFLNKILSKMLSAKARL